MLPDFLLIGTPCWETVARVPDLPPLDMGPLREALPFIGRSPEVVEAPGGSAAVTAGHLARRGRTVMLLGAVGDDEPGRRAAAFLARRGVPLPCPPRPGRATKRTAVLVHRETGRTAFFADLPRGMAPPPSLQELPAALRSPLGWVHGDYPSPLLEALLRQQPFLGASLDLHDPPRRAPSILRLRRLLPRLTLLQVRRTALEELAPGLDDSRPVPGCFEEAARRLARLGPLVVVTDGDRGSWWFHPGGDAGFVSPIPLPHLVDPTGAGDAFAAAWIEALSRGAPPGEAGIEAAEAAARACAHLGPWPVDPGHP